MLCTKCGNQLNNCTCDDLEKRLDKAVDSGFFEYKKCCLCKKHYARCKCEEPKFILASEMKLIESLSKITDGGLKPAN